MFKDTKEGITHHDKDTCYKCPVCKEHYLLKNDLSRHLCITKKQDDDFKSNPVIEEYIRKEMWEQTCKGCGFHDTIWKTVVQSKEWQDWYDYASKNVLYDVDECQELGVMTKEHWGDFIKFTLVNYIKNK